MRKPYEYKVVEDIKFPEELSRACIDEALNFLPRDGDVGVVTYPRSGTTWTQQIVLRLLKHGNYGGSWRDFSSQSPCIELQGTKTILSHPDESVFYKTHIPYAPKRWNPKSKYLWVVRNPRDVCVSSYHLFADLHHVPWRKRLTFEGFAQHFCAGETYYGGYWDHFRSWYPLRNEPNVLMLVYEQMKRDPRGHAIKIGEFLGGKAAELVQDDKFVDGLLDQTSVVATRRQANTGFVRSLLQFNKFDINLAKEILRPRHAIWKLFGGEVSFVRKGVVGDWRNHFEGNTTTLFEEWIAAQPECKEVMPLFDFDTTE